MGSNVGTAVGCAVGIPIGVGLVVAFIFWYRMQQRFKKESKHDMESMNEQICFTDNGILRLEHEGKRDSMVEVLGTESGSGLGSSDDTVSIERKEERLRTDCGRKSVYVPAYRRKLQNSLTSNSKQLDESASKSRSDSIVTADVPKRQNSQVTILDQMIPVLPDSKTYGNSLLSEDQESIFNKRNASNDTLLKSINNFDLGAYPKRASSTQLSSNNAPSKASLTSLQTSSSHQSPENPLENVFETPKSAKDLGATEKGNPNELYHLKNNYDITNADQIAEEDQYENEFTNYSENKREFIDKLRPKKI